jgi:translocation and assembly module TamB
LIGPPEENAPDGPQSDDATPDVETPWRHTRRELIARWLGAGVAVLLAIVVALGLTVRFGLLTETGRNLVAVQLEGLPLGPFGKLHVEGLTGDVLRDFRLRRLAVIDSKGVWLDARDIGVRWRSTDLLRRRVHIESLSAGSVEILRQPVMTETKPAPSSGGLPVSIRLDRLQARLETQPAFSVQRGLFDVGAHLLLQRNGGVGGAIDAESLLRSGDGLDARFDLGLHKRIRVDARAFEAGGGALAGSLGLPAHLPFVLSAHANGAVGDGQLKVRALSGGHSIAEADGAWSKGGGGLTARLSLAASSLTDRYMRALGPEVRLAGQTQLSANHQQSVRAQVSSENLLIAANGLIDPDKIDAPNGIQVQAQVKDMSRIVQSPAMGRLTADGVFTTANKGWRLAGKAALERVSAYDYALARVAGPIEVDGADREIRLKADLTGVGGQGKGLLAGAAGAHLHAVLDGSRLNDGRILIRSLKADGDGLSLDASGERSLFGGLNFKGDLKLSNLVASRVGAHGAVDVQWSANQGRANQPWVFTANAQGDKLATGYAELDRLLGPKPRLAAQARWDQGTIVVSQADLTGAAAKAGVTGQIGKDWALKFALTWSAEGPFEAGPVEIAGKASGGGALTGTLGAPRADLTADFDKIDFPGLQLRPAHVVLSFVTGGQTGQTGTTSTNGEIAITAGGDYGPAHGKAAFQFLSDGLDLTGIDAAAGGMTVAGDMALHGQEPSSANLTLSAVTGAFLAQGRMDGKLLIVNRGSGATGDFQLTAKDAVPRGYTIAINSLKLSASGPLDKLPYTLSGDGVSAGVPFSLKGGGAATEQGGERTISFAGAGKVRRADFKTLSPALVSFGGPDASVKLSLGYGGGTADVDLRQSGEALSGKATLAGVDVGALGEDMVGKVTGDLSVNSKGAALDGTINARLEGVRSRDAPANLSLNGDIRAVLAGPRLTVDATAGGANSADKASVSLVLPAVASAAPFRIAINRTEPISGHFDANAELQPIWDLFFGGDRTLGGRLVAQGTLAGTLNDLRPAGHANLSAGHFEDAATGLKLRNFVADVDLRDNVVNVDKFAAADAKSGTLSGEGSLSLAAGGSSSLTISAKSFQLLDNDAAKATASGSMTVTRGGDGRVKLAGQLNIDRADISAQSARAPAGVTNLDVTEINTPGGQEQVAPGSIAHAPAVSLEVKLRAARGIFVKGFGLNTEMSLDADVGGTTAAPVLSGTARVVRGDYDLAGKRFEIDDDGVVYLDTSLERMRLDLTAKLDDPTLTAMIKIGGTAAKPEITLSSTPELPSDEILSQVLFGSSAAQLSPVQAAQLAAAVTSLATGGGFDVMGGLKNFARLDRLALGGGDPATGVTVSGGKYIGRNVYLELTGGGRQGPVAEVDYRANKSLSLVSQVGGEYGAKLAVRWRFDYGKAKPVAPKTVVKPGSSKP